MGTYTQLLKMRPENQPSQQTNTTPAELPSERQSGGSEELANDSLPEKAKAKTKSPDPKTSVRISERNIERTSERTNYRTEKRTQRLPIKRTTKRYSFEFYDDQLLELKMLKREAEDRGERLTLSDMAREAMDEYLGKTVRKSERNIDR